MTSSKKERIIHSVIRNDSGERTGYHIKDTSRENAIVAIVEYVEGSNKKFSTLMREDIGSLKKGSIYSFATMEGLKRSFTSELTGESASVEHDSMQSEFAKARAKLRESSNAPQTSKNRRSA